MILYNFAHGTCTLSFKISSGVHVRVSESSLKSLKDESKTSLNSLWDLRDEFKSILKSPEYLSLKNNMATSCSVWLPSDHRTVKLIN